MAGSGDQRVVIVGGGHAGLMAAEVCARHGLAVHVYDAMPSAGRKFLLAGLGGLNLTHSEPAAQFNTRYYDKSASVADWLGYFNGQAARDWAQELGIQTFVGSSGRVFPAEMKAAPLLRAWLTRLRNAGVIFHMRHRLVELSSQRELTFDVRGERRVVHGDAIVLACGGASWPALGSDGSWVAWLGALGVAIHPLLPANCGFEVPWSDHFIARQRGQPVKNVRAWVHQGRPDDVWALGDQDARAGEMMISEHGLEGGLIYSHSRALRKAGEQGDVSLAVDLLPHHDLAQVKQALARGRGAKSWSSHLASALGLKGVRAALLRERAPIGAWESPDQLAMNIKRLLIPIGRPRPIGEAISSAGGVCFEALGADLQCSALPRVFCAGEMIDWEAPTGGYLLTAAMASGRVAGHGVVAALA